VYENKRSSATITTKKLIEDQNLGPVLQNFYGCNKLDFHPSLTLVSKVRASLNGTAWFKNVKNCLNTNIYSYLETSVGQSSDPYLNVVHFFNTSVNWTSVAA
jgi:hypothetical protein